MMELKILNIIIVLEIIFSIQTNGDVAKYPQDLFLFTNLIPNTGRESFDRIFNKLNIAWREISIDDRNNSFEITNDWKVIRLIRPDCKKSCDHQSRVENRKKRAIFGIDNREPIRPKHAKEYPRSGVVRLNVGCTGMLIDSLHVLTAAHCFHLRNRYTVDLLNIQVGVLKPRRVNWYPIKKVYLPLKWIENTENPLDFDYSLVELKEPLKRIPTPLGLSVFSNCISTYSQPLGSEIEFLGFPDDKSKNRLWKSNCSILDSDYHLLWQECDATHGNSGSGITTRVETNAEGRENWYTVGVFSGIRYNRKYGRKLNVGIRMNIYNFLTVCIWSGQLKECMKRYEWLFPSPPLTLASQY